MQIKFKARKGLLLAEISGEWMLNQACNLLDETIDCAIECNAEKVLLEGRALTGHISTFNRYEYTDYFVELVLKAQKNSRLDNIRFGVVALEPILDPLRFGETVARNRGVDIKVSDSFPEILNFLNLSIADLEDLPVT